MLLLDPSKVLRKEATGVSWHETNNTVTNTTWSSDSKEQAKSTDPDCDDNPEFVFTLFARLLSLSLARARADGSFVAVLRGEFCGEFFAAMAFK